MHAPTLRTSSSVSFPPGVDSAPTGGGNPSPNYDPAATSAASAVANTFRRKELLMRALKVAILTATSVCAVLAVRLRNRRPRPGPRCGVVVSAESA
jgi:hypothetical protein